MIDEEHLDNIKFWLFLHNACITVWLQSNWHLALIRILGWKEFLNNELQMALDSDQREKNLNFQKMFWLKKKKKKRSKTFFITQNENQSNARCFRAGRLSCGLHGYHFPHPLCSSFEWVFYFRKKATKIISIINWKNFTTNKMMN